MSISDIVQLATDEMISNTEDFIKSSGQDPLGKDPISIMVNGVTTILSRQDYKTLKAQNNKVKDQMKADIKMITRELKESYKK